MRLARAEEAGNPNTVSNSILVVVLVKEMEQVAFDFAGDNEFLELVLQMLVLVRLYHRIDCPENVLFERFLNQHVLSPVYKSNTRVAR